MKKTGCDEILATIGFVSICVMATGLFVAIIGSAEYLHKTSLKTERLEQQLDAFCKRMTTALIPEDGVVGQQLRYFCIYDR